MSGTNSPATTQGGTAAEFRTLAGGAGLALVGKVGGRGLFVLGQVLVARMVGPAAFGLYGMGWTMVNMAGLLAPLGIEKGVLRYLPKYAVRDAEEFKGVIIQGLGIAVASAALMTVALWVFAPALAADVFQKPELAGIARAFSFLLVPMAALKVTAASTRSSKRMRYAVVAEDLGQPATNLVLVVVVFVLGWGVMGAVAALVISFVLAFLLSAYQMMRLFPQLVRAVKPVWPGMELFKFSIAASAAGVFSTFTGRIDRLAIGGVLPRFDVGVYQAASQMAVVFGIVLAAFNAIFAPMISDLHNQGAYDRLSDIFKVSTKWALYICLPLFLVLFAAPTQIIRYVYGEEYIGASTPMVILSVGQLFNAATGGVGFVLIMTGKPVRYLVITAIAIIANVVAVLTLSPQYGLPGAAIGTALAVMLMFGAGLFEVYRSTGLWPYDRRYWKAGVAAVVAAGVSYLLVHFIPTSGWWVVLLLLVAVMATFGISLWLLGWEPEDREVMELLKARWAGMNGKR